jgi:hypothetical protein
MTREATNPRPAPKSANKGIGKIALGAPDTTTGTGTSGEGFLPYIEQRSLKQNSGKTKGSERGVIAIIKPGDKTGIGNAGFKGKGKVALGGSDTKGIQQNTFGGAPGGHSSLNFRLPGGSMTRIGSIGAGSFRAR